MVEGFICSFFFSPAFEIAQWVSPLGFPLSVEALRGIIEENGEFSSKPCLITWKGIVPNEYCSSKWVLYHSKSWLQRVFTNWGVAPYGDENHKNHLIHSSFACFAQKSQGKRPLLIRRILSYLGPSEFPPCLQGTIDDGGIKPPRDPHEGYLVDIKLIETPSAKKSGCGFTCTFNIFQQYCKAMS